MWVRRPAGWPSISRSRPMAPPRARASSRRSANTPCPGELTNATTAGMAGTALRLLQRRPGEEQPLLAHTRKAHHRFGLVALALDEQHHALPQVLGARGAGRRRRAAPDGSLDDALASTRPHAAAFGTGADPAPGGGA